MEFINENLTLIIVVSVIVIMTLIGYIADKSNFVEKRKEKEKNKKEKFDNEQKNRKTKEQQQFDAEIGDGKDLIMDEGSVDFPVDLDRNPWEINIPEESQNSNSENINGTSLNDNLDFDVPVELSDNTENNFEDINSEETITAPLNNDVLNLDEYDNSLNEEDTKLENDTTIEEQNNKDLSENNSSVENKEIEEENNNVNTDGETKTEKTDEEDINLPEIDSLKEVNDDDIWRF